MNKLTCIAAASAFIAINVFADTKFEFGTCSTDLKTHCSASQDDHAKHNCLAKLDKSKLSKSCLDYRIKMKDQNKNKTSKVHNEHKGHNH